MNTNLLRIEAILGQLSFRQMEIVEASIGLISKGGIQALTIKKMAAKIGLSEPALYRHFKNKQDILLAVLEFFRESQAGVGARLLADGASPLKTIEKLMEGVFRGFAMKPAMATVIFADGMFQNDPRLSKAILAIMDERREQFISLIGAGQAKGEIRKDIERTQLALILMGTMRLLVTRWRLCGFAFDLIREGELIMGTLRKVMK